MKKQIRMITYLPSQNYRSPDALGTVWYNKLRDIEFDFKEILENTNWDQFQS